MKINFEFFSLSTAHPDGENEDSYYINDKEKVFAVMDGVSGHGNGRFASNFVRNGLVNSSMNNIEELVRELDKKLAEKNHEKETDSRTSLSLLKFAEEIEGIKLEMINIGDSRIYRFRDNKLLQISVDDDFLNLYENLKGDDSIDLVNLSETERKRIRKVVDNASSINDIDEKSMWFWDRRGYVTNSIGKGRAIVKAVLEKVVKNDLYLLLTDGVTDNITEEDIEKIIVENNQNLNGLLSALVERAKVTSTGNGFRSKLDDITAIILEII